jgi:hypothetical protein
MHHIHVTVTDPIFQPQCCLPPSIVNTSVMSRPLPTSVSSPPLPTHVEPPPHLVPACHPHLLLCTACLSSPPLSTTSLPRPLCTMSPFLSRLRRWTTWLPATSSNGSKLARAQRRLCEVSAAATATWTAALPTPSAAAAIDARCRCRAILSPSPPSG